MNAGSTLTLTPGQGPYLLFLAKRPDGAKEPLSGHTFPADSGVSSAEIRLMRSRFLLSAPVVALLAGAFISAAPIRAAQALVCEKLADMRLPDTTISVAEAVAQGLFTPAGANNPIANLPPFCRVAGTIAPTPDSDIRFEVWLPLDGWNGKFAGVGNGGWAGIISFGAARRAAAPRLRHRVHQYRPSGRPAASTPRSSRSTSRSSWSTSPIALITKRR